MAEFEGAVKDNEISGNIFVFTAPRFNTNVNSLEKQAQSKRRHFNWEVASYEIDISSINNASKKIKTHITPTTTETSSNDSSKNTQAFSELNLQYEFQFIKNSVIAYLEDTFSENSIQSSHGFDTNTESQGISMDVTNDKSSETIIKHSVQQEYAFSLEQSQKLFQEMQGFVEMSIDLSETQLNSTETASFSPSKETQSSSNSFTCQEDSGTDKSPFTKLSDCTKNLLSVNIFVVVLQINPLKEVKVKSGTNCGQFVKISSILVGDPTKEYFKVTFWREAAEWISDLNEGDVVVVKKVKIEKWNEEFYGQSTYGTTLVSLQIDGTFKVPAQWLTTVSYAKAKNLLKWLKRKHRYLVTNKKSPCKNVEWKTLKQFVPNTIVNYRTKVNKVLTYTNTKGKYEFEKRQIKKVVVVAVDLESSEEVPIYLWGRQAGWQNDLKAKIGQTWSFTFLRVECNTVHGEICLHTTPQSTKEIRNEEMGHFGREAPTEKEIPIFSSISDLLKANLNGTAITSAIISTIMCTRSERSRLPERTIDKKSDPVTVHEFFRELVYLGCKLCFRALKQDQNEVYERCSYCIQHNSSYLYGVMYLFKPCLLYLSDKSASVLVKSSHESTSKFLKDLRPQDILEDENDKLFERLERVFVTVNNVILTCETSLDENGFIENQKFHLLDVK